MEYIESILEYGVPVSVVQNVKWGDSRRFTTRTNTGAVLGPRKLKGRKILGVVSTNNVVVAHSAVAVRFLDFIIFKGAFNKTASEMFNSGFDVVAFGGVGYDRGSSTVYVDSVNGMFNFVDNVIARTYSSSVKYCTLFDALCEASVVTKIFLFKYDTLILRHSWNHQLFFEIEHTQEANAFFAKVALSL